MTSYWTVSHCRVLSTFLVTVFFAEPSPVYLTKPSYKLKSLAYTDKEFKVDALGETSTDPNTVEATVEFTPPPNWQMSDFVSANDYVHTLMCKRASTDSFTTRSVGASNKCQRWPLKSQLYFQNLSATAAEMIVPFPGKNVQSDCTYLYTVSLVPRWLRSGVDRPPFQLLGLNTICGTTVQFPDPADSGGASTAGLGIFINVSKYIQRPFLGMRRGRIPEIRELFQVVPRSQIRHVRP